MRDLAPNFAAAAASAEITPAIMVSLDFEGQPLHAWTGLGPLDYAGKTYLGMGALAEVEAIEEYSEIRAGSVGLRLTHVPNSQISQVKDLVFKRRSAEIWLVLFEGDSLDLVGVELLLRGSMDTLELARSPESSTLTLTVVNELARLRMEWGSLYTDPHQRAMYANDTGLRFVASMQDLTISI